MRLIISHIAPATGKSAPSICSQQILIITLITNNHHSTWWDKKHQPLSAEGGWSGERRQRRATGLHWHAPQCTLPMGLNQQAQVLFSILTCCAKATIKSCWSASKSSGTSWSHKKKVPAATTNVSTGFGCGPGSKEVVSSRVMTFGVGGLAASFVAARHDPRLVASAAGPAATEVAPCAARRTRLSVAPLPRSGCPGCWHTTSPAAMRGAHVALRSLRCLAERPPPRSHLRHRALGQPVKS